MAPFENFTLGSNTETNYTMSTASGSFETSSENQLSWQSAFWAVVTIALATMADAPGIIYGCPLELTFYLKLSPLTCFVDAACATFSIIEAATRPGSNCDTRQAIDNLAKRKMGSTARRGEIPRSPIRFILFVFGAVPQATKIFACRGILTTQIISGCYLASFSLDELVLVLSRKGEPDTDVGGQQEKRSIVSKATSKIRVLCYDFRLEAITLGIVCTVSAFELPRALDLDTMEIRSYVSLATVILIDSIALVTFLVERPFSKSQQPNVDTSPPSPVENADKNLDISLNKCYETLITKTLVWTMIGSVLSMTITLAVPASLGGSGPNNGRYTMFFLLCLALVADFCGVYPLLDLKTELSFPHRHRLSVKDEVSSIGGVVVLSAALCVYPLSMLLALWMDQAKPEGLELMGTVIVSLSIGVLGFYVLYVVARRALAVEVLLVKQDDVESRSFPLIVYCVLTTLAFFIYYSYEYEPDGTYRPSWTESLG